MKRKSALTIATVLLSLSIMFNSCVGSFNLTSKLYSWNKSAGDRWVNELIFWTFCIIQAYSAVIIIDGAILNTIEFWTGENPTEPIGTQTKQIEINNETFSVVTDVNGYKIKKKGSNEIIAFRFDQETKCWSLNTGNKNIPLLQFITPHQAVVYLANGSTMTVNKDDIGNLALKQPK